MKINKYRLTNADLTKGVWLTELQLLQLLKILKLRNHSLYKEIKTAYEYLTPKDETIKQNDL